MLFQLPEDTILQETEDELQHTLDEPVSYFFHYFSNVIIIFFLLF